MPLFRITIITFFTTTYVHKSRQLCYKTCGFFFEGIKWGLFKSHEIAFSLSLVGQDANQCYNEHLTY